MEENNEMNERLMFIAVSENQIPENAVYDSKNKVALVYCLKKDDFTVEILTEDSFEKLGIKREELQKRAAENMRRDYPCSIIPFTEYVKTHDITINISNDYLEGIYVLACSNDKFAYSSAGIYYSADLIKEFAAEKGCDIYIMPCSQSETYICTTGALQKDEISELMSEYKAKAGEALTDEALVFSGNKLMQMEEYKPALRKQGRKL